MYQEHMMMTDTAKAHEYATQLRAILDAARADGLAFSVSGGRRKQFKITATALPHEIDLSEDAAQDCQQEPFPPLAPMPSPIDPTA